MLLPRPPLLRLWLSLLLTMQTPRLLPRPLRTTLPPMLMLRRLREMLPLLPKGWFSLDRF